MFGLTSNPSWLFNGRPQLKCFLWLAIVVAIMVCANGLHEEKHIYQVYVGQYFQYDLLKNMAWYNRPIVTQIKVDFFRLVLLKSMKVTIRFILRLLRHFYLAFVILQRCFRLSHQFLR